MLFLRACAAALAMSAIGALAWASEASFVLAEVSCTDVGTGPTRYVDPDEHKGARQLKQVFGQDARPIGIVGTRGRPFGRTIWTSLPRFWADLKVWVNSEEHRNGPTYMLSYQGQTNSIAMTIFSVDNPEVLLKVLRCPYAQSSAGGCWAGYWIYAAAATDLPMQLRVWDVTTGRLATWRKVEGNAIALTDTTTMLGSDCHICGQDPFC